MFIEYHGVVPSSFSISFCMKILLVPITLLLLFIQAWTRTSAFHQTWRCPNWAPDEITGPHEIGYVISSILVLLFFEQFRPRHLDNNLRVSHSLTSIFFRQSWLGGNNGSKLEQPAGSQRRASHPSRRYSYRRASSNAIVVNVLCLCTEEIVLWYEAGEGQASRLC